MNTLWINGRKLELSDKSINSLLREKVIHPCDEHGYHLSPDADFHLGNVEFLLATVEEPKEEPKEDRTAADLDRDYIEKSLRLEVSRSKDISDQFLKYMREAVRNHKSGINVACYPLRYTRSDAFLKRKLESLKDSFEQEGYEVYIESTTIMISWGDWGDNYFVTFPSERKKKAADDEPSETRSSSLWSTIDNHTPVCIVAAAALMGIVMGLMLGTMG